jgi:aspartate aminotransferase
MSVRAFQRPDTTMGRALAQRVVDLVSRQSLEPDIHATAQDALDLTRSETIVLPEHIRQAAKDALDRGETHYTSRPGIPELRQAIAHRSTRDGFPATADSTVVTNGGAEAVYIALQAVLSKESTALVVDPMSPNLVDMIDFIGADIQRIDPDLRNGGRVSIADLEHVGADALVLASPSPLSGQALPPEDLVQIIGAGVDRGMQVILDRSNVPCLYDPAQAVFPNPELGARVITIGSFSAGYGLAGWRVGYFTAPTDLVAKLRGLKQAMSICTTAVSQFAALAALEGPQDWLGERRRDFVNRRELVQQRLGAVGLPAIDADAYPSLLIDSRAIDPDDQQAAARLASGAGVIV